MIFSSIESPELSLLGDSASLVTSVVPVSMAPFATKLLVEIAYVDNSKLNKSYYIYDTKTKLYTTNISDYIGGDDAVNITAIDVAWSANSGVTFAIVYTDKEDLSSSISNRIAIVQNGVLIEKDVIETVSSEVANTSISNVFISKLGTQIVFSSAANNLVDYSDTNDSSDVFLLDMQSSTLERVSQITDDDEGSHPSYALGFSNVDNITKVLFETVAAEFSIEDLNEVNDLYLVVPDIQENSINLVSKTTDNEAASIESNQAIIYNNTVVYVSDSDELVAGDSNQSQDIFIYDISSESQQRLTSILDELLDSNGSVKYELLEFNASSNKLLFSSNYMTLSSDQDLYQIYLMDTSDQSITTLSQTPDQEPGNDSSSLGIMDASSTNYAYQTEATNLLESPPGTLITNIQPSFQLFDVNQKGVTNLSLDLYKDGSSLDKSVVIDNASILITEAIDFDVVKITPSDAYNQDITITDAIGVLRHIVDLESFTPGSSGYHAADVNNDGNINISDAIEILRHIVDLEAIDTFDTIDASGNLVTTLDANASDDTPTWTIVANGDVNMSGEFDAAYVMADIV